jgi:hypothetical protein
MLIRMSATSSTSNRLRLFLLQLPLGLRQLPHPLNALYRVSRTRPLMIFWPVSFDVAKITV